MKRIFALAILIGLANPTLAAEGDTYFRYLTCPTKYFMITVHLSVEDAAKIGGARDRGEPVSFSDGIMEFQAEDDGIRFMLKDAYTAYSEGQYEFSALEIIRDILEYRYNRALKLDSDLKGKYTETITDAVGNQLSFEERDVTCEW